jgi:hypothetical protein
LVLVDTFLGLDRTLLKSGNTPLAAFGKSFVPIWETSRPNNWKKGITIQKRTVQYVSSLEKSFANSKAIGVKGAKKLTIPYFTKGRV